MATAHDPHHDALGHHITPLRVYWTVFFALMVLTVVTIAVSVGPAMFGLSLGGYAIWVALVVASFKATLVATFFMHLKYDERFNVVVFASSLFFVGVFAFFTILDVTGRGALRPAEGYHVWLEEQAAIEAMEAAAAEEEAAAADEETADN